MKANDISNIIPEGFYDLLSYVVPSAYLTCSLLYITDRIELVKDLLNKEWSIVVIILFLALGGLFALGSVLTSFSLYIILKATEPILKIGQKDYNPRLFYDINYINFRIRVKYLVLGKELVKRHARFMMIRNFAFSSLILLIIEIFYPPYCIVYLVLFIIFILVFFEKAIDLHKNYLDTEVQIRSYEKNEQNNTT